MNFFEKRASRLNRFVLILVLILIPRESEAAPDLSISIEYVGHACFVIESSTGTRVVIDPFNNHIWIGYELHNPPPANAVLITHPHYDHDASYHWPGDIPVFRRPGHFSVGDIHFEGVEGRHSDPYGKEFGQTNTIWVVEVDRVRIVHLGDNGPISPELAKSLGRVDLLMLPVDATFHILKREEVDEALALLRPRLIIPMHYQIPELAQQVQDLGPIDPWLEERDKVIRLSNHATRLHPSALPPAGSVLVFQPSPVVRPWNEAFLAARKALGTAREGKPEETLEHLRQAVDLWPVWIRSSQILAGRLAAEGQEEEAIRVLERALANAGRDDWTSTAHARITLARLYLASGEPIRAKLQARLILAASQNLELRRQASEILERDN